MQELLLPNVLAQVQEEVLACVRCPRLVAHREQVAREKKRQYRAWTYWGKPLPSFGDPNARVLVVGLAPAAHGGNRTGRMFTGDKSGDFLYQTLYRFGFANQPTALHREDGLMLSDLYITAAVRCAPPDNKPAKEELTNCYSYFLQELDLLKRIKVIIALGGIAFDTCLKAFQDRGIIFPRPKPRFGHGQVYRLQIADYKLQIEKAEIHLIASYHPSRQNTQTGRLTQEMFDTIFQQACRFL